MNINKNNLLVAKVASKDKTRYALQSVYFDKDGTVATDGHLLAKISYPSQVDNDSLPTFLVSEGSKDSLNPFLISSSSAESFIKLIPKMKKLPILENIYIDVNKTNLNGSAHFKVTDLENQHSPEAKKLDYNFPPYKTVIPNKEATFTIGFNVKLMKELCDVAEKMGLQESKFEFYSDRDPLKITGKNNEGQEFIGLLMPCKLGNEK